MPPCLTTNTPHYVPQFTLETPYVRLSKVRILKTKLFGSIQEEKLYSTNFSDLIQLIMCLSSLVFFF